MTGCIPGGAVRVIARGIAEPSGLSVSVKVPHGCTPVEKHPRISNCSPGFNRLSESAERPGSIVYFPVMVESGLTGDRGKVCPIYA